MARVDTYGVSSSLQVLKGPQINRPAKPAYQTTDVAQLPLFKIVLPPLTVY